MFPTCIQTIIVATYGPLLVQSPTAISPTISSRKVLCVISSKGLSARPDKMMVCQDLCAVRYSSIRTRAFRFFQSTVVNLHTYSIQLTNNLIICIYIYIDSCKPSVHIFWTGNKCAGRNPYRPLLLLMIMSDTVIAYQQLLI